MEPSTELQNGLVWISRIIQIHFGACSGHAAVHRPLIADGYEVMEVFRECWLFFLVLANLVIKKTN